MISFIVSAYDRPLHLRCCLASLEIQNVDGEIIVCDNGGNDDNAFEASMCATIYLDTSQRTPHTCYHGLEVHPRGEWLCFPSDDSYYVPTFVATMLDYATKNRLEFVYCDVLYDPRLNGNSYSVQDTKPTLGGIDKTAFIVSRRAFEAVGGWPTQCSDWRDGALAEALVKRGIKHGKVPGIMAVHN